MESKEFIKALKDFESDKNIAADVVLDALKVALINAFQKENGKDTKVRVEIDDKKGVIEMFHQRDVVEEVLDPAMEISLQEAQEIDPKYKLGDVFEIPVDTDHFNRMAALHVKQVLRQKIREAEKQMIYDTYIDKKDDVILGTIERVENGYVLINIGRTNALMRPSQMIPGEKYEVGQTIKTYITNVDKEVQGAQVLVSRTDPNFLKRLFENEITEIYDGTVEIRAIAREPGERSKVAVSTRDPNVDPTGACIGMKGMRIQKITSQISNEKIDVVQYYDEPELYIADSIKPANAYGIAIDSESHNAIVVVPNEELSLAIGKKGQNARLAVKLTGWKIDIKTVDAAMESHIPFRTMAEVRQSYAKSKTAVAEKVAPTPVVAPTETITIEPLNAKPAVAETPVVTKVEQPAPKAVEKPVVHVEAAPIPTKEPEPQIELPKMPHVSVVEPTPAPAKVERPASASVSREPSHKAMKKAQLEKDKNEGYKMPVYSKEELAALEAEEQEDSKKKYDEDDDFDEYDDYYDK